MAENDYSILMSVYIREKPENLREAMDSIWDQTVKTNDFVLVCDGSLTDELNTVVEEMEKAHNDLRVIRLEKNGGLGRALRTGIQYCRNELIARMDSDDISRPDRCERQIKVFQERPEISICSGFVEEFRKTKDQVEARRVLPENSEEINAFLKKRNPFNHPCVMFRKSAVEKAGGYQDFYLLEDYYLWIRMLTSGCIGYNIQQPLLWMRVGSDLYKRRAGWKYAMSQRALFRNMYNKGIITKSQYLIRATARGAASMTPNWLREYVFRKTLRDTRGCIHDSDK